MYDLFAPMAAFTIFRNRVTLFDLSLIPIMSFYYSVGKIIFYMFDDDNEFARLKPAIQYKYSNEEINKYTHDREGFDIKTIEGAARSLVINPTSDQTKDDPDIRPRVMTYSEFSVKNEKSILEHQDAFRTIARRLSVFHPETKPLFWRIMIAQARLYQFLENSRKPEFSKYFKEPESEDKVESESEDKVGLPFEVFKEM